jgi:hypothetical protein
VERHIIGGNDWREVEAFALETKVVGISDLLDHIEDLVEMFPNNERLTSQLRSMAGSLRTQRNDFSSEAARLRAEMDTRNAERKK